MPIHSTCKAKSSISLQCYSIEDSVRVNIGVHFKEIHMNGNYLLNYYHPLLEIKILQIENNNVLNKWKNISITNVMILNIIQSNISNLNFIQDEYLFILQKLNISMTNIRSLNDLNIFKAINLKILDISKTKITELKEVFFSSIRSLKLFRLENLNLQNIIGNPSKYFTKLKYLYLKYSFFNPQFIDKFLQTSKYLEQVESENFQLCCLSWEKIHKDLNCKPHPTGYLTCHQIIPSYFLKIIFILFGVMGFLGNSITIFIIKMSKKLSTLYRLCLSSGDLLSSIYMISIVFVDYHFSGVNFLKYEQEWRLSYTCSFLGILLNFSLCLSAFSILAIAIERYESVASVFKVPFMNEKRYFITLISLVLTTILSLLPIILYKNVGNNLTYQN